MTSDDPLLLESGDLSVCPELGEVRNARGESTRLGPVNMKVLALLMSRPGQVVGRDEVFESVWRNQVVGDDALTRSISDIRAEINRLSERRGLIETLPKRGYRWTAEVRRAAANPLCAVAGRAAGLAAEPSAARRLASPGVPAEEHRVASTAPAEEPTMPSSAVAAAPLNTGTAAIGRNRATASGHRRLLVWAGRGMAYALVLLLLASLAVWLADRLAHPGHPIVAVLPVAAEPDQRELAASIEQHLADYLIRLDLVDLLARSAVESRPSNPYPYFFYQFGATWLIEADVRHLSPGSMLTLDLVDARTGIVLLQSTAAVGDDASQAPPDIGPALEPLAAFSRQRPAAERGAECALSPLARNPPLAYTMGSAYNNERRSSVKRTAFTWIVLSSAMLACTVASAQVSCTRGGLQRAVDLYITAQTHGDTSGLPLAAGLGYMENAAPADIANGLINTPMTINHHFSLLDTATCQTFTEVIVTDEENPYVLGTRLRVNHDKIAEIEILWTTTGYWLFNADAYLKYSSTQNWGPIPASDRDTRDTLVGAGNAYLDAFLEGKIDLVPWGFPCVRTEGGAYTGTGSPADSCEVGVPSGVNIANRRFVVDEVIGSVVVLCTFGAGSPGGGSGAPDTHLFRVENGKLRYVHTLTHLLQANFRRGGGQGGGQNGGQTSGQSNGQSSGQSNGQGSQQ